MDIDKLLFVFHGNEVIWFGPGARYKGEPGKFISIFKEDLQHEHIVDYIERKWLIPSQDAKKVLEVTEEVPPVVDSIESATVSQVPAYPEFPESDDDEEEEPDNKPTEAYEEETDNEPAESDEEGINVGHEEQEETDEYDSKNSDY